MAAPKLRSFGLHRADSERAIWRHRGTLAQATDRTLVVYDSADGGFDHPSARGVAD
jgi:hypothetical protein